MKYLIVLFVFLSGLHVSAQNAGVNRNIDFILHLSSVGSMDEVKEYSNTILSDTSLTNDQRDSLLFVTGWLCHLDSKSGAPYLMKVSPESGFYYKSRFYSYLEKMEKAELDSALAILDSTYESSNHEINQLLLFEKAGIGVLKKNKEAYYSTSRKFNSDHDVLRAEQQTLLSTAPLYLNMKRKSPVVAGTLSAIVPGSGKFYAGNRAQGLAALIRVAALGGIVYENWRNHGLTHPQTLIFGGLFSVFYVGNIWGSVLSVQTVWNEKQLEQKHNITVGLRVPVDAFFK